MQITLTRRTANAEEAAIGWRYVYEPTPAVLRPMFTTSEPDAFTRDLAVIARMSGHTFTVEN